MSESDRFSEPFASSDDERLEEKEHQHKYDPDLTLDNGETLCPGPLRPDCGTRKQALIGPYRLLEKVGEGGMGQVWLAEQTTPVKRQVALKLIRAGMYNDWALKRFLWERQSLAIMNHPSIAKVFDAGTTPDGQYYLVMEYVPGLPITVYCDERRLSIPERLELFIKVCEGVQHAHQKAIIHRDLKPTNILVVEIDGRPTPQIIDFGLAKAASPEAMGETLLDRSGGFVGTPGYISPEQADPKAQDVDTRTDVYSLGVILHVLLSGMLPFDAKKLQSQPIRQVLRELLESNPPAPSTRIDLTKNYSTATAYARETHPNRLVRLLRGDLDAITMKALERDRALRYDSPSALAADIRRHLNHEPVLAMPSSFYYRADKFAHRHRVGMLAAASLVIMLIILAVSTTVQAVRIATERDRAEREAATAETVTIFLTDLFTVSDPSESRGNAVGAREILDKGVKQIDTSLAGQPVLHARLMATMGKVYLSLGLYAEAEPLLEKTLDEQRQVLGPENPDTLRSMHQLGKDLERQGRYAEAQKIALQTLEVRKRVLGLTDPETMASMSALVAVLYDEGQYAEAEQRDMELLDLQRRVLGPNHQDTVKTMHNLGGAFLSQGRLAESEKLYREATDIQLATLGRDHPDTLVSMTNLARVLSAEGKYEEAEKMLRETLEIKMQVLGPEHSDTLWAMADLAMNLRDSGHSRQAEILGRKTLEIRRRVLGPDHPDSLKSMADLAITLDTEQRYAEAETLYRQALVIQQRVLGPEHPDTAETKYNIACNLALRGRRNESIALLGDALVHGLGRGDMLHMADDPDLKSLHGDRHFEALVAEARNRADSGYGPK